MLTLHFFFLSEDKEDQEKLENLRIESDARDLNINKKKTKVILFKSKTNPTYNSKINDENIEEVYRFDSLGSILSSDG